MAEICTEVVRVTTTGSAGSATGIGRTGVMHGYLLDILFNFHASAPATTDTTVAYEAPNLGGVIVLTSTATDAMHAPRKQASDVAGAAITGLYERWPLNGLMTVSLAQCDALTDALVATIRYERL